MTHRDFHLPGRSPVFAGEAICATSHPLASLTALDILGQGGNAVDAAIAAAILLGFCEPQMTGLGGDMFALVQPAPGAPILGLNASGRAPASFDAEILRAQGHLTVPRHSAHAVTVPGAVDGFCRLAADHGRLGLEAVLAPAIRYADAGIPVAPRVAFDWAKATPTLSGHAPRFLLHDGEAPRPGALFRAPGQAEVLRRIARQGRAGFYEGEVAEDLVAGLVEAGGVHSLEDFAAHESRYVTPLSASYRDRKLVELPPNSQGATALLLARMLDRHDMAGLDPLGAARVHLEAEAAKLAYDARNRFLGDPETSPRLPHMLSEATAETLAGLIDPHRAAPMPPPAAEAVHRETICLSVIDRDRMAVSLIYSIFDSFGSGLASPRFGIPYHNRGAGFSLTPGHANEAKGGRRPLHTIIPAMVTKDGALELAYGVMGGQYQASGHLRVLSNLLDFGMDLQQAVDAPRSFPQNGALELERGYGSDTRAALAALGHQIATPDAPLGGAQAVQIDLARGVLIGASDPRKDGCALGR
ncbi:MAG: gamma-glutamyltransferase family protein [Pseudomonadota bacterium]